MQSRRSDVKATAVLAVVFLTCAAAAGARAFPQAKQAGAADPAIKAVADDYVKASLAGDAKAIAALYTEDAVEMPPNGPMVKGRAAIEKYYTGVMGSGTKLTTFTITHLESHASGDTAYDVGTYNQSLTPAGGAPVSDSGKYVVLLKKAGGAWKVAYAIYNSDSPPRQ
jgi:uncharacterized protein (TIGR02246 family)